MRYDNPELLQRLAAEYVIGTLQGGARRRFEKLLGTDEEARFQRDFWEQRLAEFGQVLSPLAPPLGARVELLRLTATSIATANAAPVAVRRRRRPAAWTYAAGFATAASLVLAFLLGQRHAERPEPRLGKSPVAVAVAEAPREAWPIYAAEMRMPASDMGWLLSVTPDRERLIAVAAEDFFQSGRAELQLWCVVPGEDPVAIGVLPSEKDASATFEIPASVRGHSEVTFAITLEPLEQHAGEERRPSAPVLNQTQTLLDSI